MDMRIPFACVLIAGGALALVLPGIGDEASSDGTFAHQSPAGADAETTHLASLERSVEPTGWADNITLNREQDGHFYANVVVDGTPSLMLVDTGASVIALTGDDAMAMGLYWDDNEIGPVAQGASGTVYGVHTKLAHVRLGSFEAHDVQAMIIPEGLGISLLGQSFLSTVSSVEIADDRMVLASQR